LENALQADDLVTAMATQAAQQFDTLLGYHKKAVSGTEIVPAALRTEAYYGVVGCFMVMRRHIEAGLPGMTLGALRFCASQFLHRRELGVADVDAVTPAPIEALHEWEAVLRQAHEGAPHGVIVTRFDQHTMTAVYVNEQAARLLGYNVDDLCRLQLDPHSVRKRFFLPRTQC
jgi:PAS domain-containing protein